MLRAVLIKTTCAKCGRDFEAPRRSKPRRYCSLSCANQTSRNWKHGLGGTTENNIWKAMRKRCNSPSDPAYPYYGARGIKCCERWSLFKNFLDDMGPRPPGLSLERIDNDGDYEPSNCKWATVAEQGKNRRNCWTPFEIRTLKEASKTGLFLPDIVKITGRSAAAISGYAYRYGISIPRRPHGYSKSLRGEDDYGHREDS